MNATAEKKTPEEFTADLDFYVIDGKSYRMGLEDGKEIGKSEGIDEYCRNQFISVYDLNRTAECAELFIERFYRKFPECSILQARLGTNPSHEPTAFFVTDVPKNKVRDVCDLERNVEFEFSDKNKGNPICVWSVSGGIVQNEINADFPFVRKAVAKNA